METIEISFSYNWNNKLDCKAFTTLRLHNPKKHIINIRAKVSLKGQLLGTCRIVDVKKLKLDQINNYIAFLDTGYSAVRTQELIKKMYPNKNWDKQLLDFILLEKVA